MAIAKTDAEKAIKGLEEALHRQYQVSSGVRREGTQYILPEHSTLEKDIKVLSQLRDAEEQPIATSMRFDAYPDDALYAFYSVMGSKFGELMPAVSFSFFGGMIPGEQRTITIGPGETQNVPVGKTKIYDGLPIIINVYPSFDNDLDMGGYLDVEIQTQRKYEPLVKDIEKSVRIYLKNNSIFNGRAINSDFTFMDIESFDPARRVVYSRQEREDLGGLLFAPIVDTREWVSGGRPLKRGVLLFGDYGTGKTLTLLYLARLCVEHGWTFINVRPGDDIARVLRFARNYQPALVAFEDIDREAGNERTDRVNQIINQFDGVVSKSDKIMVVMTTNNEAGIQPAMLRPGRIDASIRLGVLDKYAVASLVENELRDEKGVSTLEGELDPDVLFEHAQGYTSAYIAEACSRAHGYALMRKINARADGTDGTVRVRVNQADIIGGLDGLRAQWELMRRDRTALPPTLDIALGNLVARNTAVTNERVGAVETQLARVVRKIGA
jgi:hypothetical protein